MSLSSIAAEQREREEGALRSFLAFSLIGSLALHAAVLTFGNFWSRTPEKLAEEPIEVLVVDPPNPQVPEPKEEAEPKGESVADDGSASEGGSAAGGGGGGGGGGGTPITASAPSSQPPADATVLPKSAPSIASSAPPVIAEKQPTPVTTARIQKLVENLNTEPAQQQKPAQTPPPEIAAEPKPVITPSPNSLPPQTRQQDTEKLRQLLAEVRNSRQSQGIATNSTGSSDKPSGVGDAGRGNAQGSSVATGSGIGTGSGFGTGTGTGSGSGSGSGTGTGTGSGSGSGSGTGTGTGSGPGTSRGEGSGNGDPTGSGSGRLGCRKCSKPKYPESARRRGVEGTAQIRVDVDDKGNVTNVRLAESSGNSALDEAAIREARRWKFDTPNGGRQGITAKVDFALEGSERSRRARERQRQREASRRKRQTATENATRKPAAPSTSKPAATETTVAPRRQRVETSSPNRSQQATPRDQRRLRQSVRRKRTRPAQATTPSQRRLLDSLRLHQQGSQSAPKPANSAPSGGE